MLSFSVEQLWISGGLVATWCALFVVLGVVVLSLQAMAFSYPLTLQPTLHFSFHSIFDWFISVKNELSSLSTKPIKTTYINNRIGDIVCS